MDTPDLDSLNELFSELRAYDRQGQRIDYSQYRRLHADLSYRILARDAVGELEVVTAWLGLDQGDADRPWIFGTVTLSRQDPAVDEQEIFSSAEAEALTTHAEVLALRVEEHARRDSISPPDAANEPAEPDAELAEEESGSLDG